MTIPELHKGQALKPFDLSCPVQHSGWARVQKQHGLEQEVIQLVWCIVHVVHLSATQVQQ